MPMSIFLKPLFCITAHSAHVKSIFRNRSFLTELLTRKSVFVIDIYRGDEKYFFLIQATHKEWGLKDDCTAYIGLFPNIFHSLHLLPCSLPNQFIFKDVQVVFTVSSFVGERVSYRFSFCNVWGLFKCHKKLALLNRIRLCFLTKNVYFVYKWLIRGINNLSCLLTGVYPCYISKCYTHGWTNSAFFTKSQNSEINIKIFH